MADGAIIGVDLGGTNIRAAHCDNKLNLLKRVATDTDAHEGLDATLNRIKQQIRAVLPADGSPVAGIGISAPGPLNPETGVVVAPPNLPGWHNVPLGDLLMDEFGVPVYVGNDANVAALAETLRGAAVGYNHVVFITVSTGIGGGIISDGRLLLGNAGLGAEVGHIPLVVADKVTTLEKESAGPAMARKARSRIEAGEDSMMSALVAGDLTAIDGKIVGIAAKQGDAVALSIVNHAAHIAGLGVVTLLHLFNPEIVVMGGGVINGLGELFLKPMWETIREQSLDEAYWQTLRIERAALGDDVSIIGSAALVPTKGGVKRLSKLKEFFENEGSAQ